MWDGVQYYVGTGLEGYICNVYFMVRHGVHIVALARTCMEGSVYLATFGVLR